MALRIRDVYENEMEHIRCGLKAGSFHWNSSHSFYITSMTNNFNRKIPKFMELLDEIGFRNRYHKLNETLYF